MNWTRVATKASRWFSRPHTASRDAAAACCVWGMWFTREYRPRGYRFISTEDIGSHISWPRRYRVVYIEDVKSYIHRPSGDGVEGSPGRTQPGGMPLPPGFSISGFRSP